MILYGSCLVLTIKRSICKTSTINHRWDSETGLLVHSLEFSKPINCVYLLDTGLFAGDSGGLIRFLDFK